MTILELADIDAYITDVQVLRGVSLDVAEGEVVSLVGPNGAGKTTTLGSIVGLIDRVNGTIRYDSEQIDDLDTYERKRQGIGFAPQERRLFTRLTARENIQMTLWGTDEGGAEFDVDQRLATLVDVFPMMESFLDRPAGNLSGGEQQMVAISRALAPDPDLVLLDEPFEGLAPSIRSDLREAIERIRSDLDVSLLVAESQINHVESISDRTYVIERGEIVSEGTPDELAEDEEVMQILEG